MHILGSGVQSSRTEGLTYKVVKFSDGQLARHMLVAVHTYVPLLSVSVYEVSYSMGNRRFKSSIKTLLYHVAFLFSWARLNNIDIEMMLLKGHGIDFKNVRRFSRWLEKIILPPANGDQINRYVTKVLQSCSSFTLWFVENFTPLVSFQIDSNISYMQLVESHKKAWSDVMIGGKQDAIAQDLTDDELCLIEKFLKAKLKDANKNQGLQLRNYILWRLLLRFGLRIGEALALRLEDLDLTGEHPSLEIVRIDERGMNYVDPRIPNNPLVKTYGRLLYFAPDDLDIIEYIEEYVSKYRVKPNKRGNGSTVYLGHDFLFVTHGSSNKGSPLSNSSAYKLSKDISSSGVVIFHWHILRHAVFNRLYEAASLLKNNATQIDHIVYMGGWGSPNSLRRYAKRAIRDLARNRLIKMNKNRIADDD
jgi:hypothetical protein